MEKEHCFKVYVRVDGLDGSFVFAKEKQAVFETGNYEEALECYKLQLSILRELQCTANSLGKVKVELEDTEYNCVVIFSYSPMLHVELQRYLGD